MNKKPDSFSNACCGGTTSCGPAATGRRDFVKASGLTAAMLMAGRMNVMAGPFANEDFEQIIPSDKKLSKEWIESLYARGEPLRATGADLKFIGMPINGICTGQVYLGGDGRLWYWNLDGNRDAKQIGSGPRFTDPDTMHSPMDQGFALEVDSGGEKRIITLDSNGFEDVVFTNRYPMAQVTYADAACPVRVELEAYTPFIPLNRDDSSYPVIVMRYTIKNISDQVQQTAIAGWVENFSNFRSGQGKNAIRLSRYRQRDGLSAVELWAKPAAEDSRPEQSVVFADFEAGDYGDWKVQGDAFGEAPASGGRTIQKLSGFKGQGLVNSWTGSDELQGKLISPEFKIEQPYLNFLIGGGRDEKKLNISLWVDGKKVRSAAGKQSDAMAWAGWNVAGLVGKQAHLEILDASSHGWGHIDIDHIVFSTHPPKQQPESSLERATDFGSIALGLLGNEAPDLVDIRRSEPGTSGLFASSRPNAKHDELYQRPFNERGFASMGRRLTLQPGEEQTVCFTLSWRFPNANYVTTFGRKPGDHDINFYSTLWPTAVDAAGAVAVRETELHETTRTWVETWYDSTLPYWLLERTFVTLNCMQTQVAERLALQDGMYNLDEGVNCCPGNCTHVWQYAQGLARVFPVIERESRDKVEYGKGFRPNDGSINFRHSISQFNDAIDGQCGTILRVLRESQMTTDYRFLESIWDRTRLSMEYVIRKWDPDGDGLLAGAQHNTLDEPWFGQVHWLINLYHAALKASAVMARQMKQPAVAERYESIVANGTPKMVDMLWNEQYGHFIHKPGPGKAEQHGSTNGCHIDQVLGEFWLWNVGLDRVLPQDKIRRTLESLWTYNFAPNVGDFRKVMTDGRWYAVEGNAGLIMCSFPHGKIEPKSGKKNYAGYLNECMTGFEWQVAAHMIWEGLVEKGLAIGKAIYDRYLPKDRNPYNEIECSDHYARAMASYSAFMAVCGYRYDGPEGKLAFGPRMQQDNFRAAFTTAEGWGRFQQTVVRGLQTGSIELRYGQLELRELAFDQVDRTSASRAEVTLDDQPTTVRFHPESGRYVVRFPESLRMKAGQHLRVRFL
ncbi:non-lysosomal glucosylceramidase [Stieleria sp. ICT_E10.1]|uniref:non-lysosomal glucosylceramidase n=1 Tax=Stieleria sedimenti TaxID=2976331 RepID=UPI0021807348|nr:non-lysosomal glucosylceramidase [Stieleria sedimenti]MCS7468803.1 non-lysosomal glucosylceramidase [Stieleria sedimenti]